MRNISLWARDNKWPARFIIVISHLLLIFLAFVLGTQLIELNILIPSYFGWIAIAGWLLAAFFYPVKKSSFSKRKFFDLLIPMFGFLIFCTVANQGRPLLLNHFAESNASIVATEPTLDQLIAKINKEGKKSLTPKEKRLLRKQLRTNIGLYVTAKFQGDDDAAARTGFIILTIIGALGLLFLVSALACNISCGGAEGLAVLVGLLGFIGVIWLTIVVIRSIKRKYPKEKKAN